MADSDDKTEEPTGKKIGEARQKGMVAKSMDLNSALVLGTGTACIWLWGGHLAEGLQKIMVECFKAIADYESIPNSLIRHSWPAFKTILFLFLPISFGILLVGVSASIAQVGYLWTLETLKPKLSKIFSFAGLIKMFSLNSLVEVVKSITKMFIVGLIAFQVVHKHFRDYLELADMGIYQISATLFSASLEVLLKCALVLLFLGVADLMYQKFRHLKELRMSKTEVKDEVKNSDGDPQVRGKLKSLRMQMHRNVMMNEIPNATVVITNPTHIAIAIRYRQGEDTAPVVLAKGKRLIAQRIREIATENAIPIVENKPLARSMYDVIEVGMEIPTEFFAAIAEILAYVYGLKNQRVG